MGFLIQWFWYLVAFILGTVVAWVIAVITVRRTSEEEAFADLPGSRSLGASR